MHRHQRNTLPELAAYASDPSGTNPCPTSRKPAGSVVKMPCATFVFLLPMIEQDIMFTFHDEEEWFGCHRNISRGDETDSSYDFSGSGVSSGPIVTARRVSFTHVSSSCDPTSDVRDVHTRGVRVRGFLMSYVVICGPIPVTAVKKSHRGAGRAVGIPGLVGLSRTRGSFGG